jgi:hypothetical protein
MTATRGKKSRSIRGNVTPMKMRDVKCGKLSYVFKVATSKFDLGALRIAVEAKDDAKRGFHAVNTRDSKIADYHAHFEWSVRDKLDEVRIEITYIAKSVKSKPSEEAPFAEDLMRWVGQFFKHQDANARIHSDFEFDAKTAALSWFPLPLRTKITHLGDAILDSIAVALPSQPDCVSRFFLSEIKDALFVGIESERRVTFSEFSLDKELQAEKAFVDKVVEVQV